MPCVQVSAEDDFQRSDRTDIHIFELIGMKEADKCGYRYDLKNDKRKSG